MRRLTVDLGQHQAIAIDDTKDRLESPWSRKAALRHVEDKLSRRRRSIKGQADKGTL